MKIFGGGVRGQHVRDEGLADESEEHAEGGVATVDEDSFMSWTTGDITAVDFWAPWCGPCHAFAPIFEETARRYGDRARFGRCNIDEAPGLAGMLGIMSIPTIVVFDPSGNEIERVVGLASASALQELIEHALGPLEPTTGA